MRAGAAAGPRAALTALAGALALALILLSAAGGDDASARALAGPLPDPGCGAQTGLNAPAKKEIAQEIVSSAENSTLNWRGQYGYIEYNVEGNRAENRGYTGGLIGFTSRTGDMLDLVRLYKRLEPPTRVLTKFLPALRRVEGTPSRKGLGRRFERAWERAAHGRTFRIAQGYERDRVYFCPAVRAGRADGIGTLGQFVYYDALVMHGPGSNRDSFGGIRREAQERAAPPSEGGDESAYLNAFLDVRRAAMKREQGHSDTSRIDDAQRRFLREGNLGLDPPLVWHVYGDRYEIR
jgi:chitosanase